MRMVLAALALSLGLAATPVLADDAASSAYGDLKQVPLTEAQVQHYVDSMADMQAAMGDAPADAAEPDAKTMAKLGAIAKKHGFASFDEYNSVAGNIAVVVDGVDPETKKFVGADKVLQKEIAEIKAKKDLKPADRDSALADLQTQMKSVVPVKVQSNIELVLKHYDQLKGE